MTDPKHAPRAPRVPFALLVTGLLVGGLALLLTLNTFSAANELQRNGLTDKDAVVAAQVEDLRNEVAASSAPANIAAAAEQLGMVPDGHPAFLVVGADGVVRVMGRPGVAKAAPLAIPTPGTTKPTPKPGRTATPSRTAPAGTSSKTAKATRTSGRAARTPSRSVTSTKPTTPTKPTKPTSTPTPVVTLPGGAK